MAAKRGADLLILAAHAPELVGLRTALGPTLSGAVSNVRVTCATVGVGLPAAAAGTMRHVRDVRVRAVLLLGSCGLYPTRAEFRPLTAFVPTAVRLVDGSVLAEKAAFPAPMQLSCATDSALSEALARVDPTALRGEVATTPGITTDDTLARSLARKSGCAAENLEAFAVALACASCDLPFVSVLIATNAVGSEGRGQWRKYQRKAAERGAQVVLDFIEQNAKAF